MYLRAAWTPSRFFYHRCFLGAIFFKVGSRRSVKGFLEQDYKGGVK